MFLNHLGPGSKGGESRPGCPSCEGIGKTIQFNWRVAREQPNSEWGRYAQSLLLKKNLKRGFLHECPACGEQWYLDGAQETMALIPKERSALVREWDSTPLILSVDLWEKAKAIGATPAHPYSGEKDYAEVPCKVLTQQGEWIDKCLISFKATPPLTTYENHARFVSDISDIQPSDYALPVTVRVASSQSKEARMGRAPTYIKTPEGRSLCLNWSVNFLDHKGLKGKDVTLALENLKPRKGRMTIMNEPIETITFFIGDWTESARELFRPS